MRIDGVGTAIKRTTEETKQPVKPLPLRNNELNGGTGSRLMELGFTGAAMKARFHRPDGAEPTPPPVTTPLQTNGTDTETTYRVGDPTRPNIHHDNGFLQNPNDPNDPNPIPTTEPTEANRDYYNDQLDKTKWAQRIDNFNIPFRDEDDTARRLEDGIEAYRHFLEGNGTDRNFSYNEFIEEDDAGQTILNNAIGDTQRGVEQLYNQMIAENPALANQTITFNVTGGVITVGGDSRFPYPDTENWQKAIGGHSIWNSASVTVTPPTEPGGEPTFSMDYTLHAEDRYNFNPGQNDIATGDPDEDRGLTLERTGLAHQYMQYSTAEREVTWTQGDIQGSTDVSNPEDSGR